MKTVEVKTQGELDEALKAGNLPILVGNGSFVVQNSSRVEARGSSRVEARGSSRVEARGSSRVEAWGSSHVVARESSHVVAWESSRVLAWGSSRVVARGSSSVEARGSSSVEAWESSHVEAWGSSRVLAWGSSRVVARGSSSVEAWESSHVVAISPYVAIRVRSSAAQVEGGILLPAPKLDTVEDWCAFYGRPITDGVVTLYKAVRDDYRSSHGFLYLPGTMPAAPDWDGGQQECGGGLHFSPHPAMALTFDRKATRFVACPVAVADIRTPRPSQDAYMDKVKAARVCGPVVEVDRDGQPITPASQETIP